MKKQMKTLVTFALMLLIMCVMGQAQTVKAEVEEITTVGITLYVGETWCADTENIDVFLRNLNIYTNATYPKVFWGEEIIFDNEYLVGTGRTDVIDSTSNVLLDALYTTDEEFPALFEKYNSGQLAEEYGCDIVLVDVAEGVPCYIRAEKPGTTNIVIPEYSVGGSIAQRTLKITIPVTIREPEQIAVEFTYNYINKLGNNCVYEDAVYVTEGTTWGQFFRSYTMPEHVLNEMHPECEWTLGIQRHFGNGTEVLNSYQTVAIKEFNQYTGCALVDYEGRPEGYFGGYFSFAFYIDGKHYDSGAGWSIMMPEAYPYHSAEAAAYVKENAKAYEYIAQYYDKPGAVVEIDAFMTQEELDAGRVPNYIVNIYSNTNVSATPISPEQRAKIEDFVERMYTIILNREADANGLKDWALGLIQWRIDGAEVVNGFVDSEEFAARGLSDEDFIKTLYLAVLNREADANGLADWLRAFELGQTRQDLVNGFVTSAEFAALCDSYGILAELTQRHMVTSFVERMYTIALDRESEEAGLEYWVTKLMSGQTDGKTVVTGFLTSPEFSGRNLENEEFIKVLYQTILGREASESDVDDWAYALEIGNTREQVMNAFIESEEFAYLCDGYGIRAILTQRDLVSKFVERMYTEALGREADENGLNDWVNGLINQVVNGAQVADGFINSEEFANRLLDHRQYVETLYRTFFGREADEASIMGWVNALLNGMSRRDVMKGFVDSQEFAVLCENYGIIAGTLN